MSNIKWVDEALYFLIEFLDELKDDSERLKTAFEKPVLKVVRKARGYELVDIETGEEAFGEPPAGLTQ